MCAVGVCVPLCVCVCCDWRRKTSDGRTGVGIMESKQMGKIAQEAVWWRCLLHARQIEGTPLLNPHTWPLNILRRTKEETSTQSIFDANFSVKWTEQDPPPPPPPIHTHTFVLESLVVYMEYESCIHKNSLLVLVILFNSVVDCDCFAYLQFVGNWKDKTRWVQKYDDRLTSFWCCDADLFFPSLCGLTIKSAVGFCCYCFYFFFRVLFGILLLVDPGCGVLCLCVDNTQKCQTKTTTEKLCFAS